MPVRAGPLVLLVVLNLRQLAAVLIVHEGGSCGVDSLPNRVVIDKEGRPELFCEASECIRGLTARRTRKSAKHRKSSPVVCDLFKETVCADELQWTGGLLEMNNGTHRTLKTECCTYDGMHAAKTVKSIFLSPGDSYTGGIAEKNGIVQGYDLIKEVRKTVNSDNEVQYIVAIYRLPCDDSSPRERDFVPLGMRNKRRLRERTNSDDYEDDNVRRHPYAARELSTYRDRPTRRRPFGVRRRAALLRSLDDYYDYDYDYPVVRRPAYRRNRGRMEDRLWPVYYAKPKVLADRNYQSGENKLSKMIDDSLASLPPPTMGSSRALEARSSPYDGLPASYTQPGPLPPPSSSFIESQNVAPLSSESLSPAPDSYMSGVVAPPASMTESYASAPAYNSYPAAPAYQPAYPQNSYPTAPGPEPPAQQQYSYMPAPSYPSYPSYPANPNLNTVFNRVPMQCFSGDMEVETDSGVKAIRDLQVGDMVLSIDESMVTYSPVIMFLHNKSDEVADFNLIETSSGHSIKLTDYHLIYISNCEDAIKLTSAKDVKVGNCVNIADEHRSLIRQKVVKISKVRQTGIYSPLTSTGDIVVNRVLASCHSNLALKSFQQSFFYIYKQASQLWRRVFSVKPSPETELPYGVETLTSVIDLFLPSSLFKF